MGPIVLMAGILVLLYALASMFAGGGVASASRGVSHSRRYSLVSAIVGGCLVVAGVVMIAG
ncbi:MAG TPA: hypothetical protein VM307_15105 [Egibacteraceae bacterium]|nr:hypothetical protein [Egibacteraceae bacterium]